MAKKETAPKLVYETQESLYEKAIASMNADRLIVKYSYKKDNYIKVAEMLESLGDYKDAAKLAEECRELAAQAEKDGVEKNYTFAVFEKEHAETKDELERTIKLFTAIKGYKDSDRLCQECRQKLDRLLKKKKNGKRLAIGFLIAAAAGVLVFFNSPVWKQLKGQIFGSSQNNETITLDEKLRMIRTVNVGEKVPFGQAEWYVLKRDDISATLVLDEAEAYPELLRSFHDVQESTDWEKCDLREWMNREIPGKMLDEEERALLMECDTADEAETKDLVNIPSAAEVEEYPEIYSGIKMDIWLRDTGNAEDTAMFRTAGNAVVEYGCPVSFAQMYAVPEIRISLE